MTQKKMFGDLCQSKYNLRFFFGIYPFLVWLWVIKVNDVDLAKTSTMFSLAPSECEQYQPKS